MKFERHGFKSGGFTHPIYASWQAMKNRCYNKRAPKFPMWGGRGIRVCQKWRDDFSAFAKDMFDSWKPGLSIGRIDNDGDYTPENCRWETLIQQANNTRCNVKLSARGAVKTAAQWAKETGVKPHTIRGRLAAGWPTEAAIFWPAKRKRYFPHCPAEDAPFYILKGQKLTLPEYARRTGIGYQKLRGRIRRGWSLEKSVTTP